MERILKKKLYLGVFHGVSAARSLTMSKIRGSHNKTTELAVRMALVRHGVRGWKMHAPILGKRSDFVFRKGRLVVFIDGCFWHGCPRCGHIPITRQSFWAAKLARNMQRDRATTRYLRNNGWTVLRFWEHHVRDHVDKVAVEIRASLGRHP